MSCLDISNESLMSFIVKSDFFKTKYISENNSNTILCIKDYFKDLEVKLITLALTAK